MPEHDPNVRPLDPILEESGIGHDQVFLAVLFNCECHSYDDVIVQVMKAIKCTRDQAFSIADCVHRKGKAVVFRGSFPDCQKIVGVLSDIRLDARVVF